MAETSKIVDGKLEIIKSQDVVITTMTKDEIIDKIAEVQTKIDHMNIDLATEQKKLDLWKQKLELIK